MLLYVYFLFFSDIFRKSKRRAFLKNSAGPRRAIWSSLVKVTSAPVMQCEVPETAGMAGEDGVIYPGGMEWGDFWGFVVSSKRSKQKQRQWTASATENLGGKHLKMLSWNKFREQEPI